MSIAGIILVASEDGLDGLEASLRRRECVLEMRRTPADAEIRGLAVVLERPSALLRAELGEMRGLPGVEALHLVYADYEDDLDESGNMPCPPRKDVFFVGCGNGEA